MRADLSPNKKDWTLTFSDEFNSLEFDTVKWIPNFRWGSGGPNGPCYKRENLEFKNGYAFIKVEREDCRCSAYLNGVLTHFDNKFSSGMICSSESFEQTFGLFEIRCKVPKGSGLWPAFWLASNSSWPPEIDVFEFRGFDPHSFQVAYSCTNPKDGKSKYVRTPDCSEDFHVYSAEWNKYEIIWYFDNIEVFRTSKNIPDKPMHVIANLQIEDGGYAGPINSETKFPSFFTIDYIRVFKKNKL